MVFPGIGGRAGYFLLCGVVLALVVSGPARASDFRVLYRFAGRPADGRAPYGVLLAGKKGDLYGTTSMGGNCCGIVYRIAPNGAESVLHSFEGGYDGANPKAGLIADRAGNLYGTTANGGGPANLGTVFKLAPDGTETVLEPFIGGLFDGASPYAGLIRDEAGNLYGTTLFGGGFGCSDNEGCGTVFKIARNGKKTLLYEFQGGHDGANPQSAPIMDEAGSLYGTTTAGGGVGCSDSVGCGTVYKIAPDGTETILYAFQGGNDGSDPDGTLITDAAGNFYGTTYTGGGTGCLDYLGCGTVFELAPNGVETVLYAFKGGSDGQNPTGALVEDNSGNFYGTTLLGGDQSCESDYGPSCGTVFKIAPGGTETVMHIFEQSQGSNPIGLAEDKKGNLYGATVDGGRDCRRTGCGTVFRLKP